LHAERNGNIGQAPADGSERPSAVRGECFKVVAVKGSQDTRARWDVPALYVSVVNSIIQSPREGGDPSSYGGFLLTPP
jgi:hypothetical protein